MSKSTAVLLTVLALVATTVLGIVGMLKHNERVAARNADIIRYVVDYGIVIQDTVKPAYNGEYRLHPYSLKLYSYFDKQKKWLQIHHLYRPEWKYSDTSAIWIANDSEGVWIFKDKNWTCAWPDTSGHTDYALIIDVNYGISIDSTIHMSHSLSRSHTIIEYTPYDSTEWMIGDSAQRFWDKHHKKPKGTLTLRGDSMGGTGILSVDSTGRIVKAIESGVTGWQIGDTIEAPTKNAIYDIISTGTDPLEISLSGYQYFETLEQVKQRKGVYDASPKRSLILNNESMTFKPFALVTAINPIVARDKDFAIGLSYGMGTSFVYSMLPIRYDNMRLVAIQAYKCVIKVEYSLPSAVTGSNGEPCYYPTGWHWENGGIYTNHDSEYKDMPPFVASDSDYKDWPRKGIEVPRNNHIKKKIDSITRQSTIYYKGKEYKSGIFIEATSENMRKKPKKKIDKYNYRKVDTLEPLTYHFTIHDSSNVKPITFLSWKATHIDTVFIDSIGQRYKHIGDMKFSDGKDTFIIRWKGPAQFLQYGNHEFIKHKQ